VIWDKAQELGRMIGQSTEYQALRRSEASLREDKETVAKLDQIQRRRPTWEDYVQAGVIESVPDPGADGERRVPINGHGSVVRALQMNEEANRLSAWEADNRSEKRPKVKVRAQNGEVRYVPEERAERVERKFHRPRISITVPELPWKRER